LLANHLFGPPPFRHPGIAAAACGGDILFHEACPVAEHSQRDLLIAEARAHHADIEIIDIGKL
jgi:hypothetical protein